MFDIILPTYAFQLTYAKKLVDGIPDEKWAAQPVAGVTMNHAAWTIAHLGFVNDAVAGMIGATRTMDEALRATLGPGSKPVNDRSAYAPADVLLAQLETSHHLLAEAAKVLTPEAAAQPAIERLRNRFPTVGHMVAGLMTSHYGTHIGQLSAWRRAMGYPSVF